MKGRMCDNGETEHKFVPREEEEFLTITLEELLVTMVIDAYEDRKVVTFDLHGAYPQTDLHKYKFTLLLLEVKFEDILCDINPKYKQHARFKDGRKKLFLRTLKAIYGMI